VATFVRAGTAVVNVSVLGVLFLFERRCHGDPSKVEIMQRQVYNGLPFFSVW